MRAGHRAGAIFLKRMIPKSGNRFSEKIVRNQIRGGKLERS
jgi:hypothetical protein